MHDVISKAKVCSKDNGNNKHIEIFAFLKIRNSINDGVLKWVQLADLTTAVLGCFIKCKEY